MTTTQHTPISNGTLVRMRDAHGARITARITQSQDVPLARNGLNDHGIRYLQNGCTCDGVHYLVRRDSDSRGRWYCPQNFQVL